MNDVEGGVDDGRVVFGLRPVEELCRARPRDVSVVYVAEGQRSPEVQAVLTVAKDRGIAVEWRPRQLVADLAGSSGHQGIVAIAGAYKYVHVPTMLEAAAAANQPALLVMLDGLTDPQNVGAIVRSAEVFGAHGVAIPDHKAAPITAGAIKASAGATERVSIARVHNFLGSIDKLRESGVKVWGTGVDEGTDVWEADLTVPTAFVIGSEGRGLREAVARRCDGVLRIPMAGKIASLNASAAAAILLYEAARQRSAAEKREA
ncbi:MAG: 23S rRNA (guanosine(2251)-2'-O)-methyltransferase RlmB [Deltaproteobacteria bacterium]|nr:23S rRNA (guanosine(2251)-2'-O)-methyltransferase RlmB [Deltaproteobacteria bacterium]